MLNLVNFLEYFREAARVRTAWEAVWVRMPEGTNVPARVSQAGLAVREKPD
jgi:hypothetical protein